MAERVWALVSTTFGLETVGRNCGRIVLAVTVCASLGWQNLALASTSFLCQSEKPNTIIKRHTNKSADISCNQASKQAGKQASKSEKETPALQAVHSINGVLWQRLIQPTSL